MRRRFLSTISAFAVVAVVAAAPGILASQASGARPRSVAQPQAAITGDQTRASAAKINASPAARTPWGDPDLQGIWTNATITPFERPTDLAEKPAFNEQEAAEFEKTTNQRNSIDRPPPPGSPGGYNQFWFDRGTKLAAGRQTSLVVDPPDGRIPPLTSEGAEAGRRPCRAPACASS